MKKQYKAVFRTRIELNYDEPQQKSLHPGGLGFLNFIEGVKNLYDAIHLLREISERHINKKPSDKFGRYFKVDTYVIVPESRNYWWLEEKMRCNWNIDRGMEKRDAFFYYLLVANIILLVIVGVLVFGAVKAVYFG